MRRTFDIKQITITHIRPDVGQTLSFNCPVCGTSHFETEFTDEAPTIWTCINGHIFHANGHFLSMNIDGEHLDMNAGASHHNTPPVRLPAR